jgi:hypothetical protein
MASTRGGALGERLLDEIDEDYRSSIVGEPLAQLDEGDGEGCPGNLARHPPQRMEISLSNFVIES